MKNKQNEYLPPGWVKAPLSKVVQPRGEKVSPSDYPSLPFIGMDHVEAHTTRILGAVSASEMKSNAARFYERDILYGRLRPYLNKVTQMQFEGLASAEFIIFPDTEFLSSAFLKYRLNAADFVSFASHLNEGDRPRVNFAQIGDFKILVPPTDEQVRIVTKIEELFSELNKGIESFKTAREQLIVYRQAVLKHAFEGRLTEEWRKKHAGELESPETLLGNIKAEREQRYRQQLDNWKQAVKDWEAGGKQGKKPATPSKPKEIPPLTEEELSELPEGWEWDRAGWLFESVTSGSRGWAKYYSDKGAVFIRITNLNFDSLKLDLSKDKTQHVDPPNNAEGLRTRVQEGNFLFSITGYLGMFAIAPKIDEAYVNQHIALARPLSGFSKEYFGYYVTAKTGGLHHLNRLTKGAVKAGLGLDDIQNFPFPMCSQEEQKKIVSEIESRLSVAEKLEQDIEDGLKQAEALRQSLLKKAFEGRLVPQDPNDEPASVLLERIKTEKAKLKKKTRKEKTVAA